MYERSEGAQAEVNGDKVTATARPISSTSSRASRPSSCTLSISCCSSRMSDAEDSANNTRRRNKQTIVSGNDGQKTFGSYGDILDVLERIEKETCTEVSGEGQKNREKTGSASRHSSRDYTDTTPRNDYNAGQNGTSSAIEGYNNTSGEHIRSSSKMR